MPHHLLSAVGMTRECAVLTLVSSACALTAYAVLRWSAPGGGGDRPDDQDAKDADAAAASAALAAAAAGRRRRSTPVASPSSAPQPHGQSPPPLSGSSSVPGTPSSSAVRPLRRAAITNKNPATTSSGGATPTHDERSPPAAAAGTDKDDITAGGGRGGASQFPPEPVPGGAWWSSHHRRRSSGVEDGGIASVTHAPPQSPPPLVTERRASQSSSAAAADRLSDTDNGSNTPTSSSPSSLSQSAALLQPHLPTTPRAPSALARPVPRVAPTPSSDTANDAAAVAAAAAAAGVVVVRRVHIAVDPITSSHASPSVAASMAPPSLLALHQHRRTLSGGFNSSDGGHATHGTSSADAQSPSWSLSQSVLTSPTHVADAVASSTMQPNPPLPEPLVNGSATPAPRSPSRSTPLPKLSAVVDRLMQLGVAHRHRPHAVHLHKRSNSGEALWAADSLRGGGGGAAAVDAEETPTRADLDEAVRHAHALNQQQQQQQDAGGRGGVSGEDGIDLLRDRVRAGADCRVLATALLLSQPPADVTPSSRSGNEVVGVASPPVIDRSVALRGSWAASSAATSPTPLRPLLYDVVEFAPPTTAASLMGVVLQATHAYGADTAVGALLLAEDLFRGSGNNTMDDARSDPLVHHACLAGSDAGAEAAVEACVAFGFDGLQALLDARDMGWSPLQLAAATGKRAAVSRILAALADCTAATLRRLLTGPELVRLEMTTDESDAESVRAARCVALLVDRPTADDLMSPLMHAIASGSVQTCEALLGAGADRGGNSGDFAVDAMGRTTLHHAATALRAGTLPIAGALQLFQHLLANQANAGGSGALFADGAGVEVYADVMESETGRTALHVLFCSGAIAPAASAGAEEDQVRCVKSVVGLLNNYGCTAAAVRPSTDAAAETPLHLAAAHGDPSLLRLVLDGWLDGALRDRGHGSPSGSTVLMASSHAATGAIVFNAENASSPPPMSTRANSFCAHSGVANHHRRSGSDEHAALLDTIIDLADGNGRTALFRACEQTVSRSGGYQCVVALVDEYRAAVDTSVKSRTPPHQHTCFSAAVHAGAGRTAAFLLQRSTSSVFDAVRDAPPCMLLDAVSPLYRACKAGQQHDADMASLRAVVDQMLLPLQPPPAVAAATGGQQQQQRNSTPGSLAPSRQGSMTMTVMCAVRWSAMTYAVEGSGWTVLHAACATGDDRLIRAVVSTAAAIAPTGAALITWLTSADDTEDRNTPLHIAARALAVDGCEAILATLAATSAAPSPEGGLDAADADATPVCLAAAAVAAMNAHGDCALHMAVDKLLHSPPLSPDRGEEEPPLPPQTAAVLADVPPHPTDSRGEDETTAIARKERVGASPPSPSSADEEGSLSSQQLKRFIGAVQRTVMVLERYNLSAASRVVNRAGRTALDLAPGLW